MKLFKKFLSVALATTMVVAGVLAAKPEDVKADISEIAYLYVQDEWYAMNTWSGEGISVDVTGTGIYTVSATNTNTYATSTNFDYLRVIVTDDGVGWDNAAGAAAGSAYSKVLITDVKIDGVSVDFTNTDSVVGWNINVLGDDSYPSTREEHFTLDDETSIAVGSTISVTFMLTVEGDEDPTEAESTTEEVTTEEATTEEVTTEEATTEEVTTEEVTTEEATTEEATTEEVTTEEVTTEEATTEEATTEEATTEEATTEEATTEEATTEEVTTEEVTTEEVTTEEVTTENSNAGAGSESDDSDSNGAGNVNTGDSTQVALFVVMAAIAGAAVVILKKKNVVE